MSGPTGHDWNPGAYERFRGLRFRPALDLLNAVGSCPEGDIVDLGCGTGVAGEALAARFPGRRIVGLDASPAMLAKAQSAPGYAQVDRADIAGWRPGAPLALIFSNAVLHWLPDHDRLLPRLAGYLTGGGVLAIQMPAQFDAPSHRLIREISAAAFPDRFDLAGWRAPVAAPVDYMRLLAPLGAASVWETRYLQRLDPVAEGHPVRAFTASTALAPVLEKLAAPERAQFLKAYDDALAADYPAEPDGTVLFPFRRLFITLRRP